MPLPPEGTEAGREEPVVIQLPRSFRPIAPLQSALSFPILAFRSPITILSFLGVLWKKACSCW